MRGLIYKNLALFFKGLDKRTLIVAGAVCLFLLIKLGAAGSLLASILFSLTVGMQNVYVCALDERTSWKQYQQALPLGRPRS